MQASVPGKATRQGASTVLRFPRRGLRCFVHLAQALEDNIVGTGRTSKMTAQGLTNVLWGYATLRYYPHRALTAVCKELHRRVHTLQIQASPLLLPCLPTCSLRVIPHFGKASRQVSITWLMQIYGAGVLLPWQTAWCQVVQRRPQVST